MKIYRVIYSSVYMDEDETILKIETFKNKDKAKQYYKELVEEFKEMIKDFNPKDYIVTEDKNSYERYLKGYSSQDNASIYIEEDEFYEEKEKKIKKQKEKEYEI